MPNIAAYSENFITPVIVVCLLLSGLNVMLYRPPMLYRCAVRALVVVGFFNFGVVLWSLFVARHFLDKIPASNYLWYLVILAAPLAAFASLRFAERRNSTSGLE